MSTSIVRARRKVKGERQELSLEERLHHAHQQLVLLADMFELQVVAPDYVQHGALSPPACGALTTLCRQAASDLRELLDTLPPELKNWSAKATENVSRKGSNR